MEAEFAEEHFSVAGWINAAAAGKPGDEPLDKFLAELEMRLQLSAEELEANLAEASGHAMRRIPFAVQEVYRLQGDMQGLQDQVAGLGQALERDASDAAAAVASISQLDRVKQNMEAACSTLKEATELSGMFLKVEDVFAAGDLPRAAEMLSSMRRSLSLVGDVPEFKEGRAKLRALEDRLQARVEARLAEAWATTQDDSVTKLCGLLLAVDRYATIERLFVAARLAEVVQLWEAYGQTEADLQAWLPKFYAAAGQIFERESRWCAQHLPAQRLPLVTALAAAAFTRVSKGCRERLAGLKAPGVLLPLLRDTIAFVRSLLELLRDAALADKEGIVKHILAPLEHQIEAYPRLEALQLKQELSDALPATAGLADADPEGLLAVLAGSAAKACGSASAALERCVAVTGGTELVPFIRALDGEVAAYCGRLQAAVAALSARYAGAPANRRSSSSGAAAASEGSAGAASPGSLDLGAMLQLLKVAAEVSHHVTGLEAAVRSAVTGALPRLEPAVSLPLAAALADPVALRLRASSHPDRQLAKLQKLGASLAEGKALALQATAGQLDSFTRVVHDAVNAALLAPLKAQLAGFATLPAWRSAPSAGAASGLPAFNAYPSAYVTTMGDYLMALPQQLEVLMTASGEEDGAPAPSAGGLQSDSGEELAAEWLDKVVGGAGGLYAEAILQLGRLSQGGGVQLAADIEYFNNCMAALHVVPPASLLTAQLFVGQPADTLAEAARQALAEGSGVDAHTLRAVLNMRGVELGAPVLLPAGPPAAAADATAS